MSNITLCNFINIGGDTYLGSDGEQVYIAEVTEGERFKHASWQLASENESKVYWAKLSEALKKLEDQPYCSYCGVDGHTTC